MHKENEWFRPRMNIHTGNSSALGFSSMNQFNDETFALVSPKIKFALGWFALMCEIIQLIKLVLSRNGLVIET